MLGTGRPFYLEIVNPRVLDATQAQISAVMNRLNAELGGKIRITDLQLVDKNDTKTLKDSASTKQKSYTTLVKLSSPVSLAQLNALSELKDLELKQQTPLRVMISRPDKNRDKIVHSLLVKPEHPVPDSIPTTPLYDLIRVDLTTSAGTYVKEFMHSDEGRTVPSVKELLGVEWAKVEHLDVLHVFLDWPKPVAVVGVEGGKE
ncbi:putative tRNA pseudouridine synthase Pus10 [Podochytrium sp. JEL0797]|nr:putative tRNA pseudouridine synthase Pus10 [Podochytrium sp. JEL0797]